MIGEQILLRVYLDSADRAPHTPTADRLVRAARHAGLAGATVLRGIMGFGARGAIGSSRWAIVQHVPVIVEMVDEPGRIGAFVDGLMRQIMARGMATMERAAVMRYRHREQPPSPPLRLAGAHVALSSVPAVQAGDHMSINDDGVLLRVFIGESDRHEHRPLYEAIVNKARELGLAGATVLKGAQGFGAKSVVHKTGILEMSSDLPIVIEMVDSQEKISRILPHLETMVQEGMVTMEQVRILLYRHG